MMNQRQRRLSSTTIGYFRTTEMVVAVVAAALVIQLPHTGSFAFELSPDKSRSAAARAVPLFVYASTQLPSMKTIGGKETLDNVNEQQEGQHDAAFFRPTPPMRPPPLKRRTLYDVLGASSTESRAELKQRFVYLVRLCHPDAFLNEKFKHAEPLPPPPGHSSPSLDFNEINMAWKLLSHPEYRRIYDASLAEQQQQQQSFLSPVPPPHQQVVSKSAMKHHHPWEDPKWQDFTEGLMSLARDKMSHIVKAVMERATL